MKEAKMFALRIPTGFPPSSVTYILLQRYRYMYFLFVRSVDLLVLYIWFVSSDADRENTNCRKRIQFFLASTRANE